MGREDLKIISYNVIGLGNDKKRVAIFDKLKHYKCDICYLQETFSSRDDHWTKTYIPTTLGIHWVCIGNVLNPAN